ISFSVTGTKYPTRRRGLFWLTDTVSSVHGQLVPSQKWHGRGGRQRKAVHLMAAREQRERKEAKDKNIHL
ncbi:hypothetical protein, partial [Microcystis aeruginosa]|uniref:hypothetical protein n=1 Tax=Microcystis aeruginosa TaxID=1126 RepID=UPI001C403678